MTPRIILIAPTSFAETDRSPLERLRASGFETVKNDTGRRLTAAEVVERGRGCVGIIAGVEPLDANVLAQLPGLECISRCGVGADNVDLAAAAALGIRVRTTPEAPTVAVAELAVGMILGMLRSIPQASADFHAGRWRKYMGALLQERTVGLVGLGRIGRAVAVRLRGFGCEMIGADPRVDKAACETLGVALQSLDEVLERADVISLHLALGPGEAPVLGRSALAKMRPGSWIVNVSRGSAVDEAALVDSLRSHHVAGAALDVFATEPYDGPLRGMAQVVGTPHVGSYAREARVRMELESVDNLLAELR